MDTGFRQQNKYKKDIKKRKRRKENKTKIQNTKYKNGKWTFERLCIIIVHQCASFKKNNCNQLVITALLLDDAVWHCQAMKNTVHDFHIILIIITTLSSALLGINSIALAPTTSVAVEQYNISNSAAANSTNLFIIYRPLTNSTNQNQLDYQHHNTTKSSSIVVWVSETSLTTITRSIPNMVTAPTREGKNTISFSFLPEEVSRIVIASTLQYQQQQGITHDASFFDQHSCQMVKDLFLKSFYLLHWQLVPSPEGLINVLDLMDVTLRMCFF